MPDGARVIGTPRAQDGRRKQVACIVGARPNFMKMAPILTALADQGGIAARLIHTGQHYDAEMNDVFFEQLGLPEPDLKLEIGPGSQITQTARIMMALERCFETDRPDMVLVVGDVNSTLAAALVAAKMRIPLAHVEAGLRSDDMEMPEEVNRLIVDRLADLLLTSERAAGARLERENLRADAIHFVGNVMIDTQMAHLDKAVPIRDIVMRHDPGFAKRLAGGHALVTLHRPSNVDEPGRLKALLAVLAELSERLAVVFALHPRTNARIRAAGLEGMLERPGLLTLPPLSYFEMQGAVRDAALVITDSGGLQEETTALGVPCLTMRDNTERPITVTEGTNILVGSDPSALRREVDKVLRGETKRGNRPELWDGRAANRIARILADYMNDHMAESAS